MGRGNANHGGNRAGWLSSVLVAAFVFATAGPVHAQVTFRACGLLGAMLNSSDVQAARAQWQQVDPEVQRCFTQRTNLQPSQLAVQCVTPADPRISGVIAACARSVYQARAEQQRQMAAQQAAQQAATARAEAQARAQQARLEAEAEAKKQQAQAEAAAKVRAEQRLKDLTEKYGGDDAKAIVAGEVHVGMTETEVLEARGNPQSREVVPPNDEMWIYGVDRIVISNGKVTYVNVGG